MTSKKKKTDQQLKEFERKRCVEIAKQIAAKRDDWTCKYCGVGRPQRMTHEHHIFSEGLNKAMSADTDNLITLCWIHHLGGLKFVSTRNFSFHGAPSDATVWLSEQEPELYKKLRERSRMTKPVDLTYWQKKRIQLKKELENLSVDKNSIL